MLNISHYLFRIGNGMVRIFYTALGKCCWTGTFINRSNRLIASPHQKYINLWYGFGVCKAAVKVLDFLAKDIHSLCRRIDDCWDVRRYFLNTDHWPAWSRAIHVAGWGSFLYKFTAVPRPTTRAHFIYVSIYSQHNTIILDVTSQKWFSIQLHGLGSFSMWLDLLTVV